MFATTALALLLGLLPVTQLAKHVELGQIDEVLGAWKAGAPALKTLFIEVDAEQRGGFTQRVLQGRLRLKYLRLAGDVFAVSLSKIKSSGQGKGESHEPVFLFDGTTAWHFDVAKRVARGYSIDPKTGTIGVGWMSFSKDWLLEPYACYLSCEPQRVQERFRLRVAQQDESWRWIRAVPKTDSDRMNFTVAQVCVAQQDYEGLPKYGPIVVEWRDPVHTHYKWTSRVFSRNDERVKAEDFEIEAYEKAGWRLCKPDTKVEPVK
jgi:hypothetical protein